MSQKMQIIAVINQEVNIDPREVIRILIQKELKDSFMAQEDGLYYLITIDVSTPIIQQLKKEISKEKFEYIEALIKVSDYLKKSKI
jgi:hypothetical protein